jgi:hypothetical protein
MSGAAETEYRFIACQGCDGDGGWEEFTGTYCRHTGAADTLWRECNYCHGLGYAEIEVEPITEEDTHAPL